MIKYFKIATLVMLIFFLGCSNTVESQIREYLEFYYPSSGKYYYEITFEWGHYEIETGPSADEELHPDSELYRGYITARTASDKTPDGELLYTYLVTPKGVVWVTEARDIPEMNTRQEIVEQKTEHGTSTSTSTISSSGEPVIDHFFNHKNAWRKYGALKSTDGKTYSLELETNK